ncbi:MAG: helix-turn-helix domain-containing protein [Bacteriovoracaceae bacterium]|nr:helix-turn-helix domain-containing protein [Bacteriovoracaceae bacterium]
METKNYYEVLDIPTNCPQAKIAQAYQSALIAYSEDSLAIYSLMSSDECKDIRNLIEEAYSILGDPDKRKEYDRTRGLNLGNNGQYDGSENGNNNESKKLPSFDFAENNTVEVTSVFNSSTVTSPKGINSIKKNSEVNLDEAKRKFTLDYELNEEFENKIQNSTEFSGPFLKEIREYKEVTIERLAEMTRIMKTYILHIEQEEFSKLPASAYIRGFIFQYAKHLKLNPDLVCQSYLGRVKRARNEPLSMAP